MRRREDVLERRGENNDQKQLLNKTGFEFCYLNFRVIYIRTFVGFELKSKDRLTTLKLVYVSANEIEGQSSFNVVS